MNLKLVEYVFFFLKQAPGRVSFCIRRRVPRKHKQSQQGQNEAKALLLASAKGRPKLRQ